MFATHYTPAAGPSSLPAQAQSFGAPPQGNLPCVVTETLDPQRLLAQAPVAVHRTKASDFANLLPKYDREAGKFTWWPDLTDPAFLKKQTVGRLDQLMKERGLPRSSRNKEQVSHNQSVR
jgi:hypothetical protein